MKTLTQDEGYKLIGRIHAELNKARREKNKVAIDELEKKLDEITMN